MTAKPLFPIPMERFGEDDLALAASVSSWADREILQPRASSKHDYDALVGQAFAVLQGDVGLAAALLPESLGGAGRDRPDAAYALTLAAEEVGRADVGLAFSMACYQAVAAIAMLGPSAGLSRALLAELLLGDGCPRDPATGPELALVTPAFASHATMKEPTFEGRVPQVRATREGGGWLLEAREARPLHAGGTASLFAVICSVEGEEPGLFLVPSGAPGLDRGARLRQAGLTGSPNAAISFSGVRLQDENRVCAGREALRALFTWLRLLTAAGAVGGLAAAHSILADWGEHRVIKGLGQVFKENPLTASLMTDLAARLCWGRLLVHDLAHFLAHPEAYGPAGADPLHSTGVSVFGAVMASAEIALGQAMELMASAGYAREWFLERYWRDLKCVRGLLGGSMLSRLQLARHAYGCETL